MICKTSWRFRGVHIRHTHRLISKPCSGVTQFQSKNVLKEPASSNSTCFPAFSAVVCCTSSCAFVLNDLQHLLGTFFSQLDAKLTCLLMVFNAWCPNQNVKHASKVWLVMCLSNLLLEHFFLLEKDWLTLLEIRLLLKRCEAATFTLASKV